MTRTLKKQEHVPAFIEVRAEPANLRTIVPAPTHVPAWLYWAQAHEGADGEPEWNDGFLPVLAFATVVTDQGEELIYGGAVLVPCPELGPKWIRVFSHRPTADDESAFFIRVVTGTPPERGGSLAPDWIKAGNTYWESDDEAGVGTWGPWL